MAQNTPEELEKERQEAIQQLNQILSSSRPKNLGEGLGSGVNNIVKGAVGAAGVAVLAPTLGLAIGLQSGGLLGGVFGVAGGAVIGALGAVGLAVGGVVSGVAQIVRGIAAVPASLTAPRQGKWWSETDRVWVLTNMEEEAKALEGVPEDDRDILGKLESELDQSAEMGKSGGTVEVVDMFYYETLDVPPDADTGVIKRRYYLLARQYHPDKVGADDKEAAEKFKNVAEAYQVLSDPELRARYNKEGRAGLSPDKTSVAEGGAPKLDPQILFAFLFGSDKFTDYIGRLSTATSAMVGDSTKVSFEDARKIQKRRVARMAIKLIEKITPWVEQAKNGIMEGSTLEDEWKSEAAQLSTLSFGYQLVSVIGKVYNLVAVVYEGSLDSGHGFPSLSKWAAKQHASMERRSDENKIKMQTLKVGFDMMKLQAELKKKMAEAKTDEEKQAVAKEMEDASVGVLLRVLWTTVVVDISSSIHEATQMVFFDQSVDKETHKLRALAVKQLGKIWMETPEPVLAENEETKDAKKLYEEAAFAAMLETIKRKEEDAHSN